MPSSCGDFMSALDKRVGQNLQRLRRRAAYSTVAVAAALKITPAELRRFETGEKRIGPRRLWQLSQILDCPLRSFFARTPRATAAPSLPSPDVYVRDQVVALARAYYVLGDWSSATR